MAKDFSNKANKASKAEVRRRRGAHPPDSSDRAARHAAPASAALKCPQHHPAAAAACSPRTRRLPFLSPCTPAACRPAFAAARPMCSWRRRGRQHRRPWHLSLPWSGWTGSTARPARVPTSWCRCGCLGWVDVAGLRGGGSIEGPLQQGCALMSVCGSAARGAALRSRLGCLAARPGGKLLDAWAKGLCGRLPASGSRWPARTVVWQQASWCS